MWDLMNASDVPIQWQSDANNTLLVQHFDEAQASVPAGPMAPEEIGKKEGSHPILSLR